MNTVTIVLFNSFSRFCTPLEIGEVRHKSLLSALDTFGLREQSHRNAFKKLDELGVRSLAHLVLLDDGDLGDVDGRLAEAARTIREEASSSEPIFSIKR